LGTVDEPGKGTFHIAQANLVQAGLLKNPVFHGELGFLEGNPAAFTKPEILQTFLWPTSAPCMNNPSSQWLQPN